jgi:hypothetical protein
MTVQPYQQLPVPAAWQQYQQPPPPQPALQGLSFLVHGPPKAGKSTLAASVPAPRVILDAESGSFWTAGRKIRWNPVREGVPDPGRRVVVPAGPGRTSIVPAWESAMVTVHDAGVASATLRILESGRHPFNGLSMDSVTEVQQRIIDDLAGTRQLSREQWGALLRQVTHMTRQYRDLLTNPVRQLWGICFIAGTHLRDGRWRPLLQGGSQDFVPYYVDVEGYLAAMPDGSRQLLIGPHAQFETGERVGGRLPYAMLIGDSTHPGWTIETMVRQVITEGR